MDHPRSKVWDRVIFRSITPVGAAPAARAATILKKETWEEEYFKPFKITMKVLSEQAPFIKFMVKRGYWRCWWKILKFDVITRNYFVSKNSSEPAVSSYHMPWTKRRLSKVNIVNAQKIVCLFQNVYYH